MSDSAPKFTVFTPTYNRAYCLGNVYQALLEQTFRSFEWLVIDDGSEDGTSELLEKWRAQRNIRIRYERQAHGGVHVAHNRAVKRASGELFLRLDSDDRVLPNALERLYCHWLEVPKAERRRYSGVQCLCMDVSERIVGVPYPEDVWDGFANELVQLSGEKWGFHRVDILRRYLFPVFPGEQFIPESLVWNRIGSRYRMRCINEALRIYLPGDDSLTRRMATIRYRSPAGSILFYEEFMHLRVPVVTALRAAANYVRFSLAAGLGALEIIRRASRSVLVMLAFPAGLVVYLWDHLRGRV